jgi:hypothetical protein
VFLQVLLQWHLLLYLLYLHPLLLLSRRSP